MGNLLELYKEQRDTLIAKLEASNFFTIQDVDLCLSFLKEGHIEIAMSRLEHLKSRCVKIEQLSKTITEEFTKVCNAN